MCVCGGACPRESGNSQSRQIVSRSHLLRRAVSGFAISCRSRALVCAPRPATDHTVVVDGEHRAHVKSDVFCPVKRQATRAKVVPSTDRVLCPSSLPFRRATTDEGSSIKRSDTNHVPTDFVTSFLFVQLLELKEIIDDVAAATTIYNYDRAIVTSEIIEDIIINVVIFSS